MDWQTAIIVGLVALVFLLLGLLARARGRWGRRSRARVGRALDGEADAERLLEDLGYRILDRQVPVSGTLWLDGEPVDFGVRLDLLVERRGRPFVAEVKTGDRAPDPTWGPTRRQLREYATLLPDHGVLLVDVEAGEVVEVEF
jgi:hypothetical protein